jgi:hypothetical protein
LTLTGVEKERDGNEAEGVCFSGEAEVKMKVEVEALGARKFPVSR